MEGRSEMVTGGGELSIILAAEVEYGARRGRRQRELTSKSMRAHDVQVLRTIA